MIPGVGPAPLPKEVQMLIDQSVFEFEAEMAAVGMLAGARAMGKVAKFRKALEDVATAARDSK